MSPEVQESPPRMRGLPAAGHGIAGSLSTLEFLQHFLPGCVQS